MFSITMFQLFILNLFIQHKNKATYLLIMESVIKYKIKWKNREKEVKKTVNYINEVGKVNKSMQNYDFFLMFWKKILLTLVIRLNAFFKMRELSLIIKFLRLKTSSMLLWNVSLNIMKNYLKVFHKNFFFFCFQEIIYISYNKSSHKSSLNSSCIVFTCIFYIYFLHVDYIIIVFFACSIELHIMFKAPQTQQNSIHLHCSFLIMIIKEVWMLDWH